jgi:hypothetical protein
VSLRIVEPEECLRSLSDEAVRQAEDGGQVLHCTLSMRAAVNAFVLLGLIAERAADQVLRDYRGSLRAKSLGTAWQATEGELPAQPGAGDLWQAHLAGAPSLPGLPEAVAVAEASFPATVSGLAGVLRFEWVKLAGGQWRISFRATTDDHGGEPDRPSVVMREVFGFFTLADDTGRGYRTRVEGVTWERIGAGRQEWRGELVADQVTDAPRPAALLISSMESAQAETVPVASQAAGTGTAGGGTSTAVPRWATPAEGYLAELAKAGRVKVGWTDIEAESTAEIIAAVADCLLAVGALPAGSPLLRRGTATAAPAWQDALARRWARRAHLDGSARSRHQVVLATLPFEQASAVIESVTVTQTGAGRLVGITLQGSPWVPAAPWPVITPCFTVRATSDNSNRRASAGETTGHDGILEGFQAVEGVGADGSAVPAGRGTFWLWPPLPDGAGRLAITVETLWEAATAEVVLAAQVLAAEDLTSDDGSLRA